MFRSNRPLRKVNIRESTNRPKSSAFKLFQQQRDQPKSLYCTDFRSSNITGQQNTGPIYPIKKSTMWEPSNITVPTDNDTHLPPLVNLEPLSSTYGTDYTVLRDQSNNSHQNDSALLFPSFTEGSEMSTTHDDFKLPPLIAPSLKGPSTRYDCNKKMVHQARGIVPSVNVNIPNKQHSTQYSSDYISTSTIPTLPKLDTKEKLAVIHNGKKMLKLDPERKWTPRFEDPSKWNVWRYK